MKEQAAASCYETACSIHCFKNDHRQNDHRHTAAQILDAPGSLDRQYTKSTPASAPARCAMWPTWWPAITVPPAFIDIVSCNARMLNQQCHHFYMKRVLAEVKVLTMFTDS